MKLTASILVLAIGTGVGRSLITPRLTNIPSIEGAYEALAHLFVGFLLLAPVYDWKQELGPSRLYGCIGIALTFWEGCWFFAQRALHG